MEEKRKLEKEIKIRLWLLRPIAVIVFVGAWYHNIMLIVAAVIFFPFTFLSIEKRIKALVNWTR